MCKERNRLVAITVHLAQEMIQPGMRNRWDQWEAINAQITQHEQTCPTCMTELRDSALGVAPQRKEMKQQ